MPPRAWKVVVRDRAGAVVRLPDGREMKLLVGGKSEQLPDGTLVQHACPYVSEQEVCDHVRKHFPHLVPVGAYAADRDQPAMVYPVPPTAFQHGILKAVEAELAGDDAGPFADDGLPRIVVPRRLLPRRLLPRKPLPPTR